MPWFVHLFFNVLRMILEVCLMILRIRKMIMPIYRHWLWYIRVIFTSLVCVSCVWMTVTSWFPWCFPFSIRGFPFSLLWWIDDRFPSRCPYYGCSFHLLVGLSSVMLLLFEVRLHRHQASGIVTVKFLIPLSVCHNYGNLHMLCNLLRLLCGRNVDVFFSWSLLSDDGAYWKQAYTAQAFHYLNWPEGSLMICDYFSWITECTKYRARTCFRLSVFFSAHRYQLGMFWESVEHGEKVTFVCRKYVRV